MASVSRSLIFWNLAFGRTAWLGFNDSLYIWSMNFCDSSDFVLTEGHSSVISTDWLQRIAEVTTGWILFNLTLDLGE